MDAYELAQEGLHKIDRAILMILEANPGGLKNHEIATRLDLRWESEIGPYDWIAWVTLKRLVSEGRVVEHRKTYYLGVADAQR